MIVDGRMHAHRRRNAVLIDVGFKSEGSIPRNDGVGRGRRSATRVGADIKGLIEDVEDEFGLTDDPSRNGVR